MQRDVASDDYEIIVVDNGSRSPPKDCEIRACAPNARLFNWDGPASASPVAAINAALAGVRGNLVGVFIDGARVASPRVLAGALDAAKLHPKPAVGVLSYHLGPDVQSQSIQRGYDQAVEDQLLAGVQWEEDPYRLFDIGVFADSSAGGWFATPAETNALFLRRETWRDLGGYDEAFQSPGGGLANLDIWARICAEPSIRTFLLLGEATFHQVHGGVASNAIHSPWNEFHAEYVRIRGRHYERPTVTPWLLGQFQNRHLGSAGVSVAGWATRTRS
jgi:hypothetical protein